MPHTKEILVQSFVKDVFNKKQITLQILTTICDGRPRECAHGRATNRPNTTMEIPPEGGQMPNVQTMH